MSQPSAPSATTVPTGRPAPPPWTYLAVGLLVVAAGVVTLVVGGTPRWTGEMISSDQYAAMTSGVPTARVAGLLLLAVGTVLAAIGAVAEGVRVGTLHARTR